jgi:hypothetical protein
LFLNRGGQKAVPREESRLEWRVFKLPGRIFQMLGDNTNRAAIPAVVMISVGCLQGSFEQQCRGNAEGKEQKSAV